MIQSTDNLEAANYSHQCRSIFVKLSDLNKNTNSTTIDEDDSERNKSIAIKSADRSTVGKLSNKVNDKSPIKLSDKLNEKFSKKLRNKSNDTSNDKILADKQPLGDKLIDKVNDKSNKKKSIDKSNLKSNDKLLNNHKNHKADTSLINDNLKKKENPKNLKKKDSHPKRDIPPTVNNRKRSDIENIFDLNSIKRVKAEMSNSNRPLVFCGPSGSGKSSMLKKLRSDFPDYFGFSISHTTRLPRLGEVHGQDYYYVTREEMLNAIANDEFIETAEFSGNIYGTSKKAVEDVRSKGKICILDIEIEGVKNVKKSNLNAVYIFIKPPNVDELENRLRKRGSETEENIRNRLRRAKDEIAFGEVKDNFDLLLVNDDFDSTYSKLKTFVLETYQLSDTSETKEANNSSCKDC